MSPFKNEHKTGKGGERNRKGVNCSPYTKKGAENMPHSTFHHEAFYAALSEQCKHCSLKVYPVLDSTNSEVRRLALKDAPEGTVVVAEEQQKGRGRQGRVFFSPSSTGLYMSVLLRPHKKVSPLFITTAAAVAVARAIEQLTGITAQIKWVNDIYCRGKKVCGILTEGCFIPNTSHLQYAVLGIGVNLFSPRNGFPSEIENKAGSLYQKEKPPAFLKEKLAAAILTQFWKWYKNSNNQGHLDEYRRRSLLTGRTVEVLTTTGAVTDVAVVTGISDTFALQVTTTDGEKKELSSGEVSIRL